jgi:indole-3-glycerol phosphate synthase
MSTTSPAAPDLLAHILTRKEREVRRRLVHRRPPPAAGSDRGAAALAALRRPEGAPLRVIAEVKFRSPSAGEIRPRRAGEAARVARAYVEGGAAAVSVLADGPGFGGSPLTVRRVSAAVSAPVLFKEFVLDEVQIDLARACGASMVLLLVRALSPARLDALVAAVRAAGMEPVVEAADPDELDVAIATGATIVGVNARDLRTFRVDKEGAARCLARIPEGRVAVFMSGMKDASDFAMLAATRADAVLVGEGLMRHEAPGERLRALLGAANQGRLGA